MSILTNRRLWILLAGLTFGVLGALLVNWGNPPNMGFCAACFIRDTAGALGLHQAAAVQYIRPEIIGIILGSTITALAFREFSPRGGSAPLVRFFLGAFAIIGALVFLGCPVRALFRLGGGDLNAVTGIAGLVVGVLIGVFFLKRGFNLGRATKTYAIAGWIMPAVAIALLVLALLAPSFIHASETGPGSMHAALGISLGVGLLVGFMAQRTRMCTVGGWRDIFLARDFYLFLGLVGIVIGALVTNYAVGNFGASGIYHWGFTNQPIAHNDHVWNFMGMVLAGLCFTLLGGCPMRQMILSGEGDIDAGVTFMGMLVGGGFAHNFLLASTTAGASQYGPIAVGIGLAFCVVIGFLMRERV